MGASFIIAILHEEGDYQSESATRQGVLTKKEQDQGSNLSQFGSTPGNTQWI